MEALRFQGLGSRLENLGFAMFPSLFEGNLLYLKNLPEPLRPCRGFILSARGFTVCEIPILLGLQNPRRQCTFLFFGFDVQGVEFSKFSGFFLDRVDDEVFIVKG